jgi:hypothetical protein
MKKGVHAKYIPWQDFGHPGVWYTELDEQDKYTLGCWNCTCLILIGRSSDGLLISRLFHISPVSISNKDSRMFFDLLIKFSVSQFESCGVPLKKITAALIGGSIETNKIFKKPLLAILTKHVLRVGILEDEGLLVGEKNIFLETQRSKVTIKQCLCPVLR